MSASVDALPDQPAALGEVLVHQRQRRFPRRPLAGKLRPLHVREVRLPDEGQPEAQRRHIGLVIILLPRHPAQHVSPLEPVLGDQRRAVGEIEAGCVALREEPLADLQHRDAPVGVDPGEELRRPRLALHDVIFAPLDRNAEQRRGQPYLVAIARLGIFVEDQPFHVTQAAGFPLSRE